jgi:hypothetical protein
MPKMKSTAIVLVVAVLGILVWVLFHSSPHIAVVVNGHPLVGPARLAAEGWGLLVGIVALFCAAILLVFVFAGT